jgi:hypothetical protein
VRVKGQVQRQARRPPQLVRLRAQLLLGALALPPQVQEWAQGWVQQPQEQALARLLVDELVQPLQELAQVQDSGLLPRVQAKA